MKRCRDCIKWYWTEQWKGNCLKHPWARDKYSEDADAGDCPYYVDRYAKYQAKTEVKA